MDGNRLSLTQNNTQVLKGIALLLLLCHRCWYKGDGYDDIWLFGYPLFKGVGVLGKTCVSLFVFLSGYGLTARTIQDGGKFTVSRFYRKRFLKLMINYWLIWLLFVPIGVFVFDRSFLDVYGEHYVVSSIVDFFGLFLAIFNHPYGYNPTWWFYSCIIILYLLYPIVWRIRSIGILLIPLALLIPKLCDFAWVINSRALVLILSYLLPFVCGLLFANMKIHKFKTNLMGKFLIIVTLLLLCCTYQMHNPDAVLWESLICVWLVCLYKDYSKCVYISKALSFLGRHSFNIFLFHTFIYSYYFHDFIYWSRNPIIVLLTLLFVCILISMFIEYLRKQLKLDVLQYKLTK